MSMTPKGGGSSSLKPTDAVPFIDDQGHPVQENGKTLMRPAGLDPHTFVNAGNQDQALFLGVGLGPALALGGPQGAALTALAVDGPHLSKFKTGGEWDAQRIGGPFHAEFVDYATVSIGLYGAAAGIPEPVMLGIEDLYALEKSHYPPGTKMDPFFVNLPERNVANTHLGYQLFNSGRIKLIAGSRTGAQA